MLQVISAIQHNKKGQSLKALPFKRLKKEKREMKKIILALALMIAVPVFAATNTNTVRFTPTTTSAASNQGNAQSITFTAPAATTSTVNNSGDQTVRNVPSMGAPSLTTSNDTCMGSSSIGAAGIGFGITIGSTWTDNNCTMLKNSRELWNMGMKAASLARLCMDAKNREALEETGFKCPEQKKEDKKETRNYNTGN
jgi:hypothetical protein